MVTSNEQVDPTVSEDLPVTEVMSSPALAVGVDTPLADVLKAMLRVGRRHLVVVASDSAFVGMVADRAVAAAWAADPSALSRLRAGQIADRQPSVVDVRASVREVAAVMVRDEVDAVAVLDRGGHPVGVVTGSDLVALMARTCMAGPTAAKPVKE